MQLSLAVVGMESGEWIQGHFGIVLMQIVDVFGRMFRQRGKNLR